ncbi:hypothetical protein [uncultured Thalassolituus sp.]|uniref:hypothetical protein n=1 Tax=uncultured Thalassolituus sp. TaxID=285273 RepID=UPI002634A034|nr:hypothetical protein [uncultured Thalassolituus sp.]
MFQRICLSSPALAVVSVLALAGCSSNDSSSSTNISVRVQVGQEDVEAALVRQVLVTEAGVLNQADSGSYVFTPNVTDDEGLAIADIDGSELIYFDVYGRQAATGVEQTTRRCQLVAGCGSYSFGDTMPISAAPGWRMVAFGLSDNERIRLTPFTDLAAELAYHYVYSENSGDQQDAGWLTTGGYYSVYSVVQSVSQVSRLFGIDDIQTTEPADLTQISEMRKLNQTEAMQRLRYGALIAAWQSYELNYTATAEAPFFANAVANDLVSDAAQMVQKGGSRTLNLYDLYTLAADNLESVTSDNADVVSYRDAVVDALRNEASAFTDGQLTSVVPASLSALLGSDLEDYELGINRTKAFVDVLRDYGNTFFEDGYRAELDKHADELRALGDAQADNLDQLVDAYTKLFGFYRDCYLNAGCPSPDSSWTWLSSYSYDAGTSVLSINGGDLDVSQQVADIITTDDDDAPTSSYAIDVLIKGRLTINGLRLVVDHTYENDDEADGIESASGVRVFYANQVSVLQSPLSEAELAYQLRWSSFSVYDTAGIGTDAEREVTGSFSLSYRGVDGDSGLRFNIEQVVLNSRISDVVDDDSDDDENVVTFFASGRSRYVDSFYPDREFASFNGFFTPEGTGTYTEGHVESGLITYSTGSMTISGRDVQYLDYQVKGGETYRYRFYPTITREDSSDFDGDGDTEELVDTHDYEECTLSGSSWSCSPKQRLFIARDLQRAVNELWELGVFSRPEVPGQGVYFVEFPVNAADENGCLTLADLPTTATTLNGTLYQPAVLGLSSARFTSEVVLNYDPDETEPKTLLDVQISAPYLNSVNVSLALSHDYSGVNTSGVYKGTGSDLDRLLIDYSTQSGTVEQGSIGIYKDGVSLTLADGDTDTVDSELLAGATLETLTGAPLYRYRVDSDGLSDRCVVANSAEAVTDRDENNAVFVLNYRDVVYGRIAQENGVWIIRYVDGSWESLL